MKRILETNRLILREITHDDIDALHSWCSHPLAMQYFPKIYSRKEVEAFIERHQLRYKIQGHSVWLMEEKATGKAVGQLGLVMQSVNYKAEPEIGYILHPDHWGKGYATECGIATRDYAFNTLRYPYVISLIRPINLPSQAVARRVGMQPVRKTMFFNYEHLVFQINNPACAN